MNRIVLSLIFLFSFSNTKTFAQLSVVNETDATILANALVGTGVTVSGATINCPGATQRGLFDGGDGIINLSDGIVLTTGDANIITDLPNIATGSGEDVGGPSDSDLEALTGLISLDACILEFDIIPVFDTLVFNYVFASEEYCDFSCSFLNDAFGFFFSGLNPAGGSYTNYNAALVPGTTVPVTINAINNGDCDDPTACDGFTTYPDFYVDNNWSAAGSTFDIQYDGFTVVLQAKIAVIPCESYHLKIAISDMGDGIFDSGVFLESGSLTSFGLTLSQSTNYGGVSFNAAVEGCNDGVISFIRDPVTDDSLVINFGISGTATMGVDYPMIPNSIIILPNDSIATITIPAFLDGIVEPTETVVIYLSTTCGLTETIYDSVVLNIQDNVEAEALASGDTTICDGASIQMEGFGGSEFQWYPSTYLSNDTIYNPICTPPGVGTLTYLFVVELGPCSDTTSVDITTTPGPTANAGPDDSLCLGSTINLNGTGSSSNLWEGSNIIGSSTDLNISINPTLTGQYILTATDATGCIDKDTTRIVVVSIPIVSAGSDDIICPGTNTTLVPSGGLANYLWTPSSSLSCSNCLNPIASPSSTTTYSLIGSNSFGCTNTDAVVVTVSNPVSNAGSDITLCSNISEPIGLASTTGYTYTWSPSSGLSNPNISNPLITLPNNTTSPITYTYTLTSTDINGCSETDDIEVVVLNNPIIDAGEHVTIDIGESYTMNTTVEDPSGSSYMWFPFNIEFMNDNMVQNPVVTPPTTTLYTLQVTNSDGCRNTDTVTVEVYIPPFVSLPNAFSPNGDNENDKLIPFYHGIELLQDYKIFNRWGQVVFELSNLNLVGTTGQLSQAAWDGTFNSAEQPIGSYVYYLKAKSVNNEDLFYSGNISLIK